MVMKILFVLPTELKERFIEKFLELELNRYPDPSCMPLKRKIADYIEYGITSDQILIGNGSDEVLQYLIQTFIKPSDRVLCL